MAMGHLPVSLFVTNVTQMLSAGRTSLSRHNIQSTVETLEGRHVCELHWLNSVICDVSLRDIERWTGYGMEILTSCSAVTRSCYPRIASQANKILAMRKRDELFLIKYEHVTNADSQSLERFSDTKKKGTILRDSVYREKRKNHTIYSKDSGIRERSWSFPVFSTAWKATSRDNGLDENPTKFGRGNLKLQLSVKWTRDDSTINVSFLSLLSIEESRTGLNESVFDVVR